MEILKVSFGFVLNNKNLEDEIYSFDLPNELLVSKIKMQENNNIDIT